MNYWQNFNKNMDTIFSGWILSCCALPGVNPTPDPSPRGRGAVALTALLNALAPVNGVRYGVRCASPPPWGGVGGGVDTRDQSKCTRISKLNEALAA